MAKPSTMAAMMSIMQDITSETTIVLDALGKLKSEEAQAHDMTPLIMKPMSEPTSTRVHMR